MDKLYCYKEMPIWNSQTLPQTFQKKHNTKAGVWAKLEIFSGELTFEMLNEDGSVISTHIFTPEQQPPFINPEQWHRIASFSDDMQCQLRFHCLAEDYFSNKYDLTKTHSEVVEAMKVMPGIKTALDLGCGSGRNGLYLALMGINVTAYDHNSDSIGRINSISQAENIQNIKTEQLDLNINSFTGEYDFILSTVVLMFLNPAKISDIIHNMQASTNPGGFNLIVSAMDTSDYPCTVPFPFKFKEAELESYYQDWNILKYNENIGELHRVDENGNRIKLRFATILAQKNK